MNGRQLLRRGATALALAVTPKTTIVPLVAARQVALGRALSGVEQTPTPPPSSYLRDAVAQVVERLAGWWSQRSQNWPLLIKLLPLVLLGLLAIGLFFLIIRLVRARPLRAEALEKASPVTALSAPQPEWTAEDWRRERIRALGEGRLSDALVACWWWLARSLAGPRAEAAWTSRDLLRAANRPDLRQPVAELEALRYGPRLPERDAVAGLVETLEGRLT
jgi:hypothetical protein